MSKIIDRMTNNKDSDQTVPVNEKKILHQENLVEYKGLLKHTYFLFCFVLFGLIFSC